MMRHLMIGLAAATLVGAMLIPDDASARGRGGGARVGAGGARVGAVGGARVGAIGGARYGAIGNRAYVSRPIARPGVGYGRYGYRGLGAAAVGAAAIGAAGYYGGYGSDYYGSNGCYRDSYGQLICPDQYQNQYQYRY